MCFLRLKLCVDWVCGVDQILGIKKAPIWALVNNEDDIKIFLKDGGVLSGDKLQLSTPINIDIKNNLMDETSILKQMTGTKKTVCFISAVLAVSGYFTISKIIDYHTLKQEKISQLELKVADQNADLKKIELIQSGINTATLNNKQSIELIDNVNNQSKQAYTGAIKSLPESTKVQLSNNSVSAELNNDEISDFASVDKDKLVTINETKEVTIESIKRTDEKLLIICFDGESSFPLTVDLKFFDEDEASIDVLFEAFKQDSLVKIGGTFKVRGGVIERGMISRIEKIE